VTGVRVLLVDDQALFREALATLLAVHEDVEVVGEAGDGDEALRKAAELAPDVVLMDLRMPVLDGIAATRELAAIRGLEGVRVLVLTTYDTDAHVFEALAAGASGFLLKDSGPAELLHAIRVVAAGEALLAPSVTRRLIAPASRYRPETRRSRGSTAHITHPSVTATTG
jgi:DNA-binding NarL/FixJ family response regulator